MTFLVELNFKVKRLKKNFSIALEAIQQQIFEL